MAGAGKAKRKKHQGKSNAHKLNPHNKRDGNSSFNNDVGGEPSENLDKSKQSGDKTLPPPMSRDSGEKNTPSKISTPMMSEGSIAWMKQTSYTSIALSLKGNVTCVANPKVNAPNSMGTESSSINFDEFGNLDFIKFLANCPNEMDLENWIATSEDSRHYLIMNMTEKAEYLTTHVKQWRDCAEKIMIKTTKRFNDRKIELRNMRLQKNERESLLKQKEELDSFNSMLTEKENYLRMVNRELDRVNQAIERIEAIQAANEVQKSFTSSQSKESLLQAHKRDMEILKMSKETEKQIYEVKRQFAEERRKIVELEQKLKLLNEDYEHSKATPSYGW